MARLLPKVVAATVLVAVAPVVLVFELQVHGVVTSPILAAILSAALSLVIYHVAASRWQQREGTHDVLFGELMLWGWIGRCVQERRIANAAKLLGRTVIQPRRIEASMSPKEKVAMLRRIAGDLEVRDPYTHGHSKRVARYTTMTAKQMGITGSDLRRLRTAAFVHDLGKIDTPVDVLCKPGSLTNDEYDVIKQHPLDGERMVGMLDDEMISSVVRWHHERLDGSGYPDALDGEAIPLGARIVAVADTFDAITSTRSYRGARTHKQALDIIQADAGTKLDAEAVAAFRRGYLGRRSLATWIALSNVIDRIVLWIVGDAVGSGVRLAAFTASTVALGSGVGLASAAPNSASAPQRPTQIASVASGTSGSASGGSTRGVTVTTSGRSSHHRRDGAAVRDRGRSGVRNGAARHNRGRRQASAATTSSTSPTTTGSSTGTGTTTTPGRHGRGHDYGQTRGRKVRRHGTGPVPGHHLAVGHTKLHRKSPSHSRKTTHTAPPKPKHHTTTTPTTASTTSTTTTSGNSGKGKGAGSGKH